MKKLLSICITLSLLLSCLCLSVNGAAAGVKKDAATLLANVQHMKQSTLRFVAGSKVIYIDPYMIDGAPKDGDIVLITHPHGDHYSIQDIKNVMKKDAVLVVPADTLADAQKNGFSKVITVVPSKDYTVSGIKFKTVPAYSTNKPFHPKANKWVGYILNINDATYYDAGDSDVIPEMKNIKADVVFLPVGGTYTMDYKEALGFANTIKPIAAVPIHYADLAGSTDDAQAFARGLNKGITGVVLRDLLKGVSHMKNSTIRIQGSKVIYFDPISIEGEPKDADIIFISHSHGDHFSTADIKKLMKDGTVLVAPQDCIETAVKEGITNVVCASPAKSYEIDGQKFTTGYFYNTNKEFHKKGNLNISYTVNVNNTTYYFAGDSDIIPEMKDVKANVVFLPVGGTYTMNSQEAATAANTINPLVAVPIHFIDIAGTMEDAKNFVAKLNPDIKGVILKK